MTRAETVSDLASDIISFDQYRAMQQCPLAMTKTASNLQKSCLLNKTEINYTIKPLLTLKNNSLSSSK